MNMNEFFTWHPSIVIASKSKKFKLIVLKAYANFEEDSLEYKVIIYKNMELDESIEHEELFYTLEKAFEYFEGCQFE